MSLKLGLCTCPHCDYLFPNKYELPICPRCEKQLSFYRSKYGKVPLQFYFEEKHRKGIEKKKYKYSKKILSVLPHKNPFSPIEQLVLESILYSMYSEISPSYAHNNNYTKFDTLLFTIFLNKLTLFDRLDNKTTATSLFDQYLNLTVVTASHFISLPPKEILCMAERRLDYYNNINSNNETYSNILFDAFTNIILADFKNKYVPIKDIQNFPDTQNFMLTKVIILTYISKIKDIFRNN